MQTPIKSVSSGPRVTGKHLTHLILPANCCRLQQHEENLLPPFAFPALGSGLRGAKSPGEPGSVTLCRRNPGAEGMLSMPHTIEVPGPTCSVLSRERQTASFFHPSPSSINPRQYPFSGLQDQLLTPQECLSQAPGTCLQGKVMSKA